MAEAPAVTGDMADNGTWCGVGSANVGGAVYAWPGWAPLAALRKKVSHDC